MGIMAHLSCLPVVGSAVHEAALHALDDETLVSQADLLVWQVTPFVAVHQPAVQYFSTLVCNMQHLPAGAASHTMRIANRLCNVHVNSPTEYSLT
jgi:hypothetical protein